MRYDANWSRLRTRMHSGTIRDPPLRINLCSGLEPLASGGGGAVIIRMAALPSGGGGVGVVDPCHQKGPRIWNVVRPLGYYT